MSQCFYHFLISMHMVWSAVNAINTTLLHTVHQTSLLGVACYIYIYIYIYIQITRNVY